MPPRGTARANAPDFRSSRLRSARTGHPSRSPQRRLLGWLNRNRRLTVALLLSAAAGIGVHQLTPAPAQTLTVMAAVQDLPTGRTLGPDDVTEVHLPLELLPEGTFTDSTGLKGKQLAAPLRKGQLFADSHLVGPGLLTGAPPGSAAVPLRLADPSSIQLLAPGQLINVVLTGGNGFEQQGPSEVLAEGVPVLWTSSHGGKTGQWLENEDADGLIVVTANPDQAGRLAGASTKGKLFFVLVG